MSTSRIFHQRTGQLRLVAVILACLVGSYALAAHDADRSHYLAPAAMQSPVVDGNASDEVWQRAAWRALDQRWLGPELADSDFRGQYKVAWTPDRLYVLVEFIDDVLIDTHRDPLERYWDDDTLEVFIDEDHSGGDHQYNHNAFAYHFSLDNQAIDIGTDKQPRAYNDHVESSWKQTGDKVVWEVSIEIYADDYRDDAGDNTPVLLTPGKVMGFMVAYCDNDGSELREHFMGSEFAAGDHKDRGWIDAGLFGTLELVEAPQHAE
jgi:hypothetical protein